MSTVLITGSSKGLGKALALKFAAMENDVVLHGRNVEQLKKTQTQYPSCSIVTGDITLPDTRTMLICTVQEKKVDLFINNAGIYCNKPITEFDTSELQNIVQTNLVAQILLLKNIYKIFKERKDGCIVNINSLAGKRPNEYESIYCATKYGLRGFTDSLKLDAIKNNVVVTDIYLGAMNTSMSKHRKDNDKLIQPHEAAQLIYNIVYDYSSLRVSEIEICRKLY